MNIVYDLASMKSEINFLSGCVSKNHTLIHIKRRITRQKHRIATTASKPIKKK